MRQTYFEYEIDLQDYQQRDIVPEIREGYIRKRGRFYDILVRAGRTDLIDKLPKTSKVMIYRTSRLKAWMVLTEDGIIEEYGASRSIWNPRFYTVYIELLYSCLNMGLELNLPKVRFRVNTDNYYLNKMLEDIWVILCCPLSITQEYYKD